MMDGSASAVLFLVTFKRADDLCVEDHPLDKFEYFEQDRNKAIKLASTKIPGYIASLQEFHAQDGDKAAYMTDIPLAD